MSIKVAHVIFVISTTLMSLGGAYWANETYRQLGQPEMHRWSIALVVLAVALVVYGVLFYRKLKNHPSL